MRIALDLALTTPRGVFGFVGPLDQVTSPIAAYAMRRLTNASWGTDDGVLDPLVRLRRDSDNAEMNFSYDENNVLDTDAITTFKGAANLYTVTVFDQMGAYDGVQPTAANQPPFQLTGFDGTYPAPYVAGHPSTATFMRNAGLQEEFEGDDNPMSVIMAMDYVSDGSGGGRLWQPTGGDLIMFYKNGVFARHDYRKQDISPALSLDIPLGSNTSEPKILSMIDAGTTADTWNNNTQISDDANSDTDPLAYAGFLTFFGTVFQPAEFYPVEYYFWPQTAITNAERLIVEGSINDVYSIY